MNEKTCRTCCETKALDLFSRDRSRPDGRRTACKACDVIHDANPQAKARRAEYNRSEAGKAAFRKYRRTERGAANNARRVQRLRDSDLEGFRRRASNYTLKYFKTPRGVDMSKSLRHRRLARERGVLADFTPEQWQRCLAYFDNCCAYCGNSGRIEQDHFIPLVSGGAYTAGNVVCACKRCNARKNDHMPEVWCPPETYARIVAYFLTLAIAA